MKKIICLILIFSTIGCLAQNRDNQKSDDWKKIYRATPTKINDLIHTKLEARFDFSRSWMYGKAWITLKPQFYPTDSLNLDAKRMEIKEVSLVKNNRYFPLRYNYDSLNLRITLDKTYKGGEDYTIFIDYIAKPDEIKAKGSLAISGAKGLYFINPLHKEKNKPTEIWTQGETESNSAWIPTIDKPNQKTTDEISMTVPSNFQTLSNGLLVSHKDNGDGTRTDTWNMDLPHAPYLMMMASGEFSIIKDQYEGKEVSYYVEKEYAPLARKIFGLTPEMIGYFSKITGVDFPWQKYSQIVVRDYVSGAMENTTATVHASSAQQDARQLIDGNSWEDIIAHELFHMWFGDYVTTESWSNIAMNESFADFSEVLWETYKHGRDAGDEHNYNAMQSYLYSHSDDKDLVRFYYRDREDVFDAVSYQKGGRILNMLRDYVGDSAFFKSLNLFLNTYKFKAVEAQELRLAFEAVTGEDMNWYWNQWFYGSGEPDLDISYSYDPTAGLAKVFVSQTQSDKVFKLPVAIDVYEGTNKNRYSVWLQNKSDTFSFPVQTKPDLINVDGNKILLCRKTDHKTLDNFIFQYNYAGLYLDRREAIEFAAKEQSKDPKAFEFLKDAVGDKYQGLRILAINRLNLMNDSIKSVMEPLLTGLAENDPSSLVRAAAIQALGRYEKTEFRDLFLKAVNDSSYSVSGSALEALAAVDSVKAYTLARKFSAQKSRGELSEAITSITYDFAGENDFDSLALKFDSLPFGNEKFQLLQPFSDYLKKIKNPKNFRAGIDMIVRLRDTIPEAYATQIRSYINGILLAGIASAKQSMGEKALAAYVRSKLPAVQVTVSPPEIPLETLKEYSGEYNLEGETITISLKDDKSLSLTFENQPEMELIPVTSTKFNLKFMEGYTIEFLTDDKNEVTGLKLTSSGEEVTATKKK
jgi:aminopeptidase N